MERFVCNLPTRNYSGCDLDHIYFKNMNMVAHISSLAVALSGFFRSFTVSLFYFAPVLLITVQMIRAPRQTDDNFLNWPSKIIYFYKSDRFSKQKWICIVCLSFEHYTIIGWKFSNCLHMVYEKFSRFYFVSSMVNLVKIK